MAGYWKNDKATSESIKKEWLYTGDMGYLDGDGFLYVLGSFKSLLIGSDGEKYSPEGIEEAIVEHSIFIDQMLLYNNQSPYTVALLVPNKEALIRRLETNKINTDSGEWEIQALKLLNGEIAKFRSGGICSDQFPERWIPSAFAVLGEGFTEDNKFLNSTLKIVRGKIVEFYSMRIEYLFTPEGKDPYNSQNRAIIRKWR
jgi:long-chain acyl-CoA synthetase